MQKFLELALGFLFVKRRKEPSVLGIKYPEVAGNYILLDPVTVHTFISRHQIFPPIVEG